MTRTTTTLRSTEAPPTQQIRLVRPDAAPLQAKWQQDGRQLIGQLSYTAACQAETHQVVQRERVTETRPNKAYYVAAYVTGAIISVAGVALLASSGDKSEAVYCGSGGRARSGDECTSEAGVWREGGIVLLGTGLGTMLGGVLVQARKPEVKTESLLPEQRVSVDPKVYACGNVSDLKGIVVAAELSGGGKWLGSADEQGVVRIDLGPNANLSARQTARFSLDSAPKSAESFARPGSALGELSLSTSRKLATR